LFKFQFSKKAIILASATTATGLGVTLALNGDLLASDAACRPAPYPWYHVGMFNTYDHASIRRGYEVYKQVCAACHSMRYTYYRNLVGVSHTEEEAKAEALEAQVTDGPNDDGTDLTFFWVNFDPNSKSQMSFLSKGNMYQRPGKLADAFPSPYPNDEAARAANNGGLPPDLSLIAFARKNGTSYIMSLLSGYCDPPAGVEAKEGLHYNPYFNGGWIAMAKALYDDVIEYSDGTPATTSQLSKDVSEFLRWSSEKYHDDKKKMLLKVFIFL
jgi:ubiquinol-cytochrome c reductase cytochrome c1 subunit